jgi:lysozyme
MMSASVRSCGTEYCYLPPEKAANQVGADIDVSKGIDVSHWQGNIDFTEVKKTGVKHVMMKGTEGGTYQDPKFLINYKNAQAAGLKTAVYHYFLATGSTADEQLKNIIQMLRAAEFDVAKGDRLIIDVEATKNEGASPEQMADNLHELLTLLGRESILGGKKPMIYCSPSFWKNKIAANRHNFAQYPLWIANWGVDHPTVPDTWKSAGKTWDIWQYSDKGQVNGIQGPVDLDWVRA